ncbi:MAG: gliding motility lipoprotein GldH [Bacteroidales bacterium]|jgi:gliding motility-associated lipoprotein GldH|nr:gliding motility lipoprotein GldH [Bacteroidales bacterium]
MTGRTGRVSVLSGLLLLSLFACNSNLLHTDVADIPGASWNLFNTPEFSFMVSDTTKSSDISFTIRTGSQYPFRNIFLFVTTTAPDGKSITDTLEYQLADEKGNWLGRGAGDIREMKLPYRKNVFFPQKGTYSFTIRHGMRAENLKGVYDIGIRIEKFSPNL